MSKSKAPQMIAKITCTSPMGASCEFFSTREDVTRRIQLLSECGNSNFHVTVVPAATAGNRMISGVEV